MSGTQTTVNASLFTEIPTNVLVPGNYYQVQPIYNNAGLLVFPARVLLIAQKSAAGAATPLQIYPLLTKAQATNLAGAGSMGEAQCFQALAINNTVPMDVIFVADAGGASAAAGAFVIGGSWNTAGILPLYVGGQYVQVPVGAGDTLATVGASALAAIAAINAPSLPVTAATTAGEGVQNVTLTAVNKGAEGNTIDLAVAIGPGDVLPTGMTCTVTAMAGGAVNPELTSVLTVISGLWYTDLNMPWQDSANISDLSAELDTRYTATAMLDCYGYVALTGSYGTILTAKETLNSRFISVLPLTAPRTPHWVYSAGMCAAAAQSTFKDPSRQLKGIVLPGVVAPALANRFDWEEKGLLLANGLCTYEVLQDGTVVLQRLVSANLTDNTGTPTTAWRDINAAKVATRIRYDWRNYVNLTYPSNKLADDGSLAAEYDPTVATPMRLAGSWAARCTVYGKQGWIEDIQNQVRMAVFARDTNDINRVNATQPYLRIGNLMVLAGSLQFQA